MRTLIKGGTIVNEGRTFDGSIVVDGKDIVTITEGKLHPEASVDLRAHVCLLYCDAGMAD